MLITSHLLGTLLLGKALSIETPELYVALLSGVGVDIDHIFVNKKWIQDIKSFLQERKIIYGTKQHSWLQEIVFGTFAGIVIGFLISFLWPSIHWWIFPIFPFHERTITFASRTPNFAAKEKLACPPKL